MIEPRLQRDLENQMRILLDNAHQAGQEYQHRHDRLAKIIQDFIEGGCPIDGDIPFVDDNCKNPAGHLADEILSRVIAWV